MNLEKLVVCRHTKWPCREVWQRALPTLQSLGVHRHTEERVDSGLVLDSVALVDLLLAISSQRSVRVDIPGSGLRVKRPRVNLFTHEQVR